MSAGGTGIEKPGTPAPSRTPALEIGLLLVAVGIIHVMTLTGVSRYGLFVLFLPASLLLLPLVGLRILSHPVQIYAFYLLIVVNLDFFRLKGTPLTADILTSAMFLYAVLVRFFLERKARLHGGVAKALILYMAVTLVSVVLSVAPGSSLKNWGRELQYLVFFLFLTSIPVTRTDRKKLVQAVMLSSLVPCILGLAGLALGIEQFYGQETPIAGGAEVKRIQATLAHPVVFSHYLAFVSIVTLSMIVEGTWFRRSRLIPLFMLQITVLYLTYGRTGWAELLAALIALFWILGRKKVVFVVMPAMAAGLLALLPSFLGRIQNAFEAGDNSFIWRLGLWAYALSKFPQRPIFGSGQDTFADYVAFDTGFASHQTWIGLLIETGVLGLGAFVVLQVVIGKTLARLRRHPGTGRDPILIGVSAGWVGILAGSITGDPFNLPAVAVYFWTLLALAVRPEGSET